MGTHPIIGIPQLLIRRLPGWLARCTRRGGCSTSSITDYLLDGCILLLQLCESPSKTVCLRVHGYQFRIELGDSPLEASLAVCFLSVAPQLGLVRRSHSLHM